MLAPVFDFAPDRVLSGKYKVVDKLGQGWEGEVYRIRELETGIDRAAKFFFPERNPKNRTLKRYAQKLHKLRHCPVLVQFNTHEEMTFRRERIFYLVSEYVDGILLSEFLKRQPGKRLKLFEALHLLYSLVRGMEYLHQAGEYHGDLHSENIMVTAVGLKFDLRIFDLFHWEDAKRENIQGDVCDLIRIFYDCLGGSRFYAKQPQEIKAMVCGLKRSLILKKYKNAAQLRVYLENLSLSSVMEAKR